LSITILTSDNNLLQAREVVRRKARVVDESIELLRRSMQHSGELGRHVAQQDVELRRRGVGRSGDDGSRAAQHRAEESGVRRRRRQGRCDEQSIIDRELGLACKGIGTLNVLRLRDGLDLTREMERYRRQ